jgi:hypothetical protein
MAGSFLPELVLAPPFFFTVMLLPCGFGYKNKLALGASVKRSLLDDSPAPTTLTT